VPSNWETEGFGVYNYGRGKQPESNETGTYRYKFTVPASWKGKSVHIVFEGVMTDTKVSPLLPLHLQVHQALFRWQRLCH